MNCVYLVSCCRKDRTGINEVHAFDDFPTVVDLISVGQEHLKGALAAWPDEEFRECYLIPAKSAIDRTGTPAYCPFIVGDYELSIMRLHLNVSKG